MIKLWRKKTVDCEFGESCKCGVKSQFCSKCAYYWWVDSGYGWCRSLPQPSLVAWCKDICSLFREVRNE